MSSNKWRRKLIQIIQTYGTQKCVFSHRKADEINHQHLLKQITCSVWLSMSLASVRLDFPETLQLFALQLRTLTEPQADIIAFQDLLASTKT